MGHVISEEGIAVNLQKIKVILDCLVPKDVPNIQLFMGIIGYYQSLLRYFLNFPTPLPHCKRKEQDLIGQKNVKKVLRN